MPWLGYQLDITSQKLLRKAKFGALDSGREVPGSASPRPLLVNAREAAQLAAQGHALCLPQNFSFGNICPLLHFLLPLSFLKRA